MSFLERNRVIKYKSLSDLEKKWQFFIFLQPEFISRIHMIMAVCDNTAMIVTKDKMVYGLGLNGNGRLGINDQNDIFPPKKIEELCGKNIKTFCCYDSCGPVFALTEEGKIYAWGSNIDRRLGLEMQSSRKIYLPTKFNINEEFIDIACSSGHAMALTKSGKIYTWGNEDYQQLFNDKHEQSALHRVRLGLPCQVEFDWKTETIIYIACGVMFNVIVTNNGKVYSWGLNNGRLGLGHDEKMLSPCLISSLKHVRIVKVVCGTSFTLALTAEGEVYFWGIGLYTKREMRPIKVDMSKIGKVSDIGAQDNLGAAFDENGNVFIWGKYFYQEISLVTQLSNICDIFKYNVPYIIDNYLTNYTEEKSNLLECLGKAFNDSSTSDLTIQVEGQSIHVHKAILKIRCQYYRNMFKYNWKEDNQNIITHDQFSYFVYKAFLEYLYTGIINLPSEKVPELVQLADVYGESNLKENCVLLVKQTMIVSNVAMIYKKAIQYNVKELEEVCFQFTLDYLTDVVQTESFINLDEDIKTNFIVKAAKVGAFKK